MQIYKVNNVGNSIADNPYVGRGIIAGLTEDGKQGVCAYFIMGRSNNSRNRVFVKRGEDIYTEPFDASKVEDPSLIIYRAFTQVGKDVVFTNGDQTDTIAEGLKNNKEMKLSLKTRRFEPDMPNLTPRISAVMHLGDKLEYELSILKSGDPEGTVCNRYYYEYEALPGLGHFIHTYVTDGNPLPTFQGEPERVKISSDIDEFSNELWEGLNEENKISLYVRYISLVDGSYNERLINKNK